ncbi:MAG: hypothetical protein HYZ25_11315 [Chloroflexi bacterium]|nr:hypothetical protein [Chloroflexota bacterium]
MTTWISHLRIASTLLTRIHGLDAAQFALGNVAPDSGIPDEKWEHFDPPKQVTHFLQAGGQSEGDIHDLTFYRLYLLGAEPADAGHFSYRLGYFIHLLTDILWARQVWRPTRERFARELQEDKYRMVEEIKGDWYGLDFVYLRDHPEFVLWQIFLRAQPNTLGLDFLPPLAVDQQLAHIKRYYQNQPETHPDAYTRPYLYLSKLEMDEFVLDASDQIEQVYHLLWPVAPRLDGYRSALQLLENNLDPDHPHR